MTLENLMKLGTYCFDVRFNDGSEYTVTLSDVHNVKEYDGGVRD